MRSRGTGWMRGWGSLRSIRGEESIYLATDKTRITRIETAGGETLTRQVFSCGLPTCATDDGRLQYLWCLQVMLSYAFYPDSMQQ